MVEKSLFQLYHRVPKPFAKYYVLSMVLCMTKKDQIRFLLLKKGTLHQAREIVIVRKPNIWSYHRVPKHIEC